MYDNKHMANSKKMIPYYVATASLLLLGLAILGFGEHHRNGKLVVGGLVLMFVGLGVILLAYHNSQDFWAPPIDGRLFMGLADPGQMANANYADLAASRKNKECLACQSACKACMRHPFGKKCYDEQEKCMKSKCNPNIKNIVLRDCTISGNT